MINLDKPDTLGFKKELEELVFPLALSALVLAAMCVIVVALSYIPADWIATGILGLFGLMIVWLIGYPIIIALRDLFAKWRMTSFSFNMLYPLQQIKKMLTATVDSYPGSMP